MTFTNALVRPPGDSFAAAISSMNAAIDVALAQAQHAEYCQALASAGLIVEMLPADERFPDSCFMQDPAVAIGGRVGHRAAGRTEPARRGGCSRRGADRPLPADAASFFRRRWRAVMC